MVLGDNSRCVGSLPREYRIAETLRLAPPCSDCAGSIDLPLQSSGDVESSAGWGFANSQSAVARYNNKIISAASTVALPLQEEFVVHLYAYLMFVCRSAAELVACRINVVAKGGHRTEC